MIKAENISKKEKYNVYNVLLLIFTVLCIASLIYLLVNFINNIEIYINRRLIVKLLCCEAWELLLFELKSNHVCGLKSVKQAFS